MVYGKQGVSEGHFGAKTGVEMLKFKLTKVKFSEACNNSGRLCDKCYETRSETFAAGAVRILAYRRNNIITSIPLSHCKTSDSLAGPDAGPEVN